MDEIVPGLYLGDISAALDLAAAEPEERDEWCVLSVVERRDVHGIGGCHAHRLIDVSDRTDTDLAQHFDSAVDFVHKGLSSGKRVLVHCMASISRSPTIVCAYLIRACALSAEEALTIVRARHRITGPNPSFRKQLNEYHQMLHRWAIARCKSVPSQETCAGDAASTPPPAGSSTT